MIIKYSPDKKINLSLKDKRISKEIYQSEIGKIVQYGEKKNNPKTTVVIVAYNEGDDLIRNLEYWEEQTNQDFEIILVDNGLDNKTVEKIRNFDVLYIKAKNNLGCCGGRNVGAVYASSDILVFGDADGYNPVDYIESVLLVMENEKIIAVRGKVLPIDKELQKEFMPTHYDLGNKQIASLINAEGNSAWRAKDYIGVGGFEDSLAGGEGLVLQYRMVEFYEYDRDVFVYDPSVILFHDYHQSDEKLEYKTRQNTIVQRQLQLRYPFLKSLTAYYSEKRSGSVVVNGKFTKQKIITRIQDETESEYEGIMKEKKKQRYEKGKEEMVMDDSVFTVVIPCYNLGTLLPKAIGSVFAQTLDNVEIIVVDDASPDQETQDILNDVERHVTVIRLRENGGVSVARNEGVKLAKSEYVVCLDADDTLESTYLEKVKNIFDAEESVGIVSCGVKTFGAMNSCYTPVDRISIKDALINSPVHTASCFRKTLHDNGGGYDKNLRGYEDWDHWLRIMKQGCDVRVISENLFNYYVRPGSKVETSNKNAFELVSRIIENHRDIYEKHFDYVIAKKHEQIARGIRNVGKTRKITIKKLGVDNVQLHGLSDIPRLITKAKKKFF